MSVLDTALDASGKDNSRDITKLIVMAVGGQGGGVLTSWIESVARVAGHAVQATSVAGVAQRTGATIYYVEIAPLGVKAPIFSLAPSAADVDILIAAELMEAGRAIQRGFVTPDRTVLIASRHRALAVSEKMAPGDGIAKADDVISAAENMALKLVMADMEKLAIDQGSVISASLFGALAASGALPFERESYEQAIRTSGKGVDASLAAFSAGYDAAKLPADTPSTVDPKIAATFNTAEVSGPKRALSAWNTLQQRIANLPAPVQNMAQHGLVKVVDFQDCKYGSEYLDRLDQVLSLDSEDQQYSLSVEAAKYIANAMAYDDVIRVADRKTRGSRFTRIDNEMAKKDSQLIELTEFFHPRAEEIVGLLPSFIGARVEASTSWMARIDRWFSKSRRIRTHSLRGFTQLYLVAGLRGYRRCTHRHKIEQAHISDWLNRVLEYRSDNYQLATECVRCRRLIKGYSDTHARGLSKYDQVMEGIALIAKHPDAVALANRLSEAALEDVEGKNLSTALTDIRSLA